MPLPLVILFWIWVLVSVGVYLSRGFKRVTKPATDDAATETTTESNELALDDPERWTKQSSETQETLETQETQSEDDEAPTIAEQSTSSEAPISAEKTASTDQLAEPTEQTQQEVGAAPDASDLRPQPAVAAVLAEQTLHEPVALGAEASERPDSETSEGLPVAEISSRLEPLVDESHIEPSVLSAMSPTQRASLGTSAASSGGLFDPQVRALAVDDTDYDHAPLSEMLSGIALPCDLLPAFRAASNDHYAVFTTTSASPPEVAAKLATELERLGFEVTPRPPAGARATRATSAVDVVVTLIDETDDNSSHVEVELTSL